MAPKQKGVHVSLRNVTPTIPGNEFERGMLKSDLADLGCAGLLEPGLSNWTDMEV